MREKLNIRFSSSLSSPLSRLKKMPDLAPLSLSASSPSVRPSSVGPSVRPGVAKIAAPFPNCRHSRDGKGGTAREKVVTGTVMRETGTVLHKDLAFPEETFRGVSSRKMASSGTGVDTVPGTRDLYATPSRIGRPRAGGRGRAGCSLTSSRS